MTAIDQDAKDRPVGPISVFTALSAVMEDVRSVGKNERNTAPNGNYNFRGIDAVINAVGPALRTHGVIVAPKVLDWQYGTVTVGNKQTQMGHSRLLVQFTWYGPDGDSFETVTAGEAFDSGDKATAKAHSVAFRTAMIQTLCLPTDQPDPDESTYERVPSKADVADVARARLRGLLETRGVDPIDAVDRFRVSGYGSLRDSDDADAINELIAFYQGHTPDDAAREGASGE